MFIVSKRNIIIPSPDGKERCFIAKDYVGEIPKWVAETEYFKELVTDGKISVSESKDDKSIEKAAEIPVTDHAQENNEAAEDKAKKRAAKAKQIYEV